LHVGSPKQEQTLPTHLTIDDMFRLLEVPPSDTPAGLRDRAMLEVLYSSGLRVSELVALNWGEIDATLEVVRVHGKGNKERIVPIGSKALEALERYRAQISLLWRLRIVARLRLQPILRCFSTAAVDALRRAALPVWWLATRASAELPCRRARMRCDILSQRICLTLALTYEQSRIAGPLKFINYTAIHPCES
jgi:integrase